MISYQSDTLGLPKPRVTCGLLSNGNKRLQSKTGNYRQIESGGLKDRIVESVRLVSWIPSECVFGKDNIAIRSHHSLQVLPN